MCVRVGMYMYICMHSVCIHVEIIDWLMPSVFFHTVPSCSVRQYFSLNLELTNSARLTSQWVPRMPYRWLHSTGITGKRFHPRLLVQGIHRVQLRFLCLCSKHLTYGAISPACTLVLDERLWSHFAVFVSAWMWHTREVRSSCCTHMWSREGK